MQHQITKTAPLLDEQGHLTEPGYATALLPVYRRSAIKAPGWRIKEWDYYYVGNEDYGIALTIADNSYMGLDSISFLDFNTPWEHTASPMTFFTGGKIGLPASSAYGITTHQGKHHSITFDVSEQVRKLTFHMDNFYQGKPISGVITLTEPPCDSMVIATPFAGKPKHFYYNQKINCLPASGSFTFDGTEYTFDPANSFGVLDWGRGVWTYKNTWYWGSASGLADGVPFGFNIGYGFGDTSAASENMLFYNHKAHKLDQVEFHIPKTADGKEDYLKPWTFTSNDDRFALDFVPIIDRFSDSNVLVIRSNQHQVFGKFNGTVILDDGTKVQVKDLLGFAEKVANKW
ncbi:hypothetical protein M2140_001397 [Clostridiales Family XIII bacterium PM5-7]